MENNFTVCVTQAGRNEKKNGKTFASVDWLAYQGAPDGGVLGEMDMPTWWTGTSCRRVSLPPVSWLLLEIMIFLLLFLGLDQGSKGLHQVEYSFFFMFNIPIPLTKLITKKEK